MPLAAGVAANNGPQGSFARGFSPLGGVNLGAPAPPWSMTSDSITNPQAVTVVVVDDDEIARGFLADNLTADGYTVLEASTLSAARRLVATRFVDLAIIDLSLPDGDGLELLRHVRESDAVGGRIDPNLPLLVLSGRATEVDRLRGFERGADDYLTKPFSYPELRARIAALLRRQAQTSTGARIRVGPLELDALSRQAWLDGVPVSLSNKEFGLLRALASDPTRVFTREELMRTVWGWGDEAGGFRTRTLDTHAARLRRKLSAAGISVVVNVWGVGYRLLDGVAS